MDYIEDVVIIIVFFECFVKFECDNVLMLSFIFDDKCFEFNLLLGMLMDDVNYGVVNV